MKRMLGYSWPILILGIAGILNQTADKIIFPLVYGDTEAAKSELGIYGACVKIAMIMAMITQLSAMRMSRSCSARLRTRTAERPTPRS